jgi:hypothetical protein
MLWTNPKAKLLGAHMELPRMNLKAQGTHMAIHVVTLQMNLKGKPPGAHMELSRNPKVQEALMGTS